MKKKFELREILGAYFMLPADKIDFFDSVNSYCWMTNRQGFVQTDVLRMLFKEFMISKSQAALLESEDV